MPIASNAQCTIGAQKQPGINFVFPRGGHFEQYGEIVFCFRALTEKNTLQPYNIQQVIILFDIYPAYDGPGNNFYVFYTRFQ